VGSQFFEIELHFNASSVGSTVSHEHAKIIIKTRNTTKQMIIQQNFLGSRDKLSILIKQNSLNKNF
jgi:hypothetical protein